MKHPLPCIYEGIAKKDTHVSPGSPRILHILDWYKAERSW